MTPHFALNKGWEIANHPLAILGLSLMEKLAITRRFYFTHCIAVHEAPPGGVHRVDIKILPLTHVEGGSIVTDTLPTSSAILMKVLELEFNIPDGDCLPNFECLTVHRECLLAALLWLQAHNPFYSDIQILAESSGIYSQANLSLADPDLTMDAGELQLGACFPLLFPDGVSPFTGCSPNMQVGHICRWATMLVVTQISHVLNGLCQTAHFFMLCLHGLAMCLRTTPPED